MVNKKELLKEMEYKEEVEKPKEEETQNTGIMKSDSPNAKNSKLIW